MTKEQEKFVLDCVISTMHGAASETIFKTKKELFDTAEDLLKEAQNRGMLLD